MPAVRTLEKSHLIADMIRITINLKPPYFPTESSSPGEFHLQALTDPDVTVSRHPALIDQPQVSIPSASERTAPDYRVERPGKV